MKRSSSSSEKTRKRPKSGQVFLRKAYYRRSQSEDRNQDENVEAVQNCFAGFSDVFILRLATLARSKRLLGPTRFDGSESRRTDWRFSS